MVLVISSGEDVHARTVLDGLASAGVPAMLLDLSRFPSQAQLSIRHEPLLGHDCNMLRTGDGDISLSDCKVIWWRRPQPFQLHAQTADPAYQAFALAESQEAFWGLWLALDALWVNHPVRDQDAARKVYQLKVARDVGLETPRTLVTNDPKEARSFADSHGAENTVYKAFSATPQHWRETRLLKQDELSLLEAVRLAPVIFQEYIPAKFDVRITVVGKDVFATAIHSQEAAYKVDFRMDMDRTRVEAFELPRELIRRLHTFMGRLKLVYGAIDMRLTPDGRFVFLEINPAGQWLFIEKRTSQPITQKFVELLAKNGMRKRS